MNKELQLVSLMAAMMAAQLRPTNRTRRDNELIAQGAWDLYEAVRHEGMRRAPVAQE